MARFGIIPPEPPPSRELAPLPDGFEQRLRGMLADMEAHGAHAVVREARRSAERQAWLYGFGRTYDDGRGIVTNVASPLYGWHFFLLAADVVDRELEDKAPPSYWKLQRAMAEANGLESGMSWPHFTDPPHVQFAGMKHSPSWRARALYASGGLYAVHKAVGAL